MSTDHGTTTTGVAAEPLATALEHQRAGRGAAALDVLARLAQGRPDLRQTSGADRLLARLRADGAVAGWARREATVAVVSSHTSGQLAAAVRVAALAHGLAATTVETGYRTYEAAVVDPASELYAAAPDVVLLVVDARELHLPELSEDPEADLAAEVARWTGLWRPLRERSGATVVQATFVPAPDDALGDLGAVLPGARRRLVRELNLRLADAAPAGVHLVDAEAVAAEVGARVWADSRYWFAAKHAVGLGAVGALAARLTDVAAAALGLSRKVVVLDLDNTLWGGVVGEDGLGGIALGGTPAGEAFVAFQHYVRSLRRRGLVLAVSTKNNPDEARRPFSAHPEMVLGLDDLVAFEAGWGTKPDAVRSMAATLGLGLEAFVLVDDNPAERERMRHELPQVGVVDLPPDPSGYVAALARFPGLQTVALTAEDARRTEQYRARHEAQRLSTSAASPEEFLAALGMTATVEDLSETNLARVVQLIGKTNQLNLTGRRHGTAAVEAFGVTPGAVVWAMRVRDRFDDHGLVAAVVAVPDGTTLRLDTFVMSCRVLGRTAERALLAALVEHAGEKGFARVLAHFVPSGRNAPAQRILPEAGFVRVEGGPDVDAAPPAGEHGPVETWELVVGRDAARGSEHLPVRRATQVAAVA
ncbi:HAD-IIIC family phosphatase [Cellulomonas endophytica]|uniref:HAD-IIIC family phosphatase n=1 Tax=Cellulomonas endophytica TaxID=2494735 RepID=UPI0013E911C6|nr:HAD-IIIC family phosphatase [Cellulomonas endophytica]